MQLTETFRPPNKEVPSTCLLLDRMLPPAILVHKILFSSDRGRCSIRSTSISLKFSDKATSRRSSNRNISNSNATILSHSLVVHKLVPRDYSKHRYAKAIMNHASACSAARITRTRIVTFSSVPRAGISSAELSSGPMKWASKTLVSMAISLEGSSIETMAQVIISSLHSPGLVSEDVNIFSD